MSRIQSQIYSPSLNDAEPLSPLTRVSRAPSPSVPPPAYSPPQTQTQPCPPSLKQTDSQDPYPTYLTTHFIAMNSNNSESFDLDKQFQRKRRCSGKVLVLSAMLGAVVVTAVIFGIWFGTSRGAGRH